MDKIVDYASLITFQIYLKMGVINVLMVLIQFLVISVVRPALKTKPSSLMMASQFVHALLDISLIQIYYTV
jgi:hypothetical protein